MGRGLLPNTLNMVWGVCVCIALSFPRYEVSLLVQNQEGWGREEGGCKEPGYEGR